MSTRVGVEHFHWLSGPQMMDGLALGGATRGELKFTAPLTGITAAVAGVILNLAVCFAWHPFWPNATASEPFADTFDGLPVIVALAAFVALWRYKADIMQVIGVCALLGLAYSFFM